MWLYFRRAIVETMKFILKLLNTIFYRLLYGNDFILINSWVDQWFGYIKPRNFGDELNIYLIEGLTNKKVVVKNNTLFARNNFTVIGSVVEHYSGSSYVWGSGAIEGEPRKLKEPPKEVLAVRGKLTQKYLLDNNVSCPSVYGDPALLLPYLYDPIVEKKYKYGFIPHYSQLENPIVMDFLSKYDEQIHLIAFKDYGDWHNVIKDIKSCEMIISASLHGLIISDAYAIPNVWVKVTDLLGDEYKFKDYFSGIDREYYPPYYINRESTLDDIEAIVCLYKPLSLNLDKLINSCPFELTIKQ